MRIPNCNCSICGEPLYRRPCQLRVDPNRVCPKHRQALAGKGKGRKAYEDYIALWKCGKVSGLRGTTSVSEHIRRYLALRSGNKCERCGWAEVNQATGKVPLEINHKDGQYKNNKEENLEYICPNCHSLTPTYKSLNKGNGRPRKQ